MGCGMEICAVTKADFKQWLAMRRQLWSFHLPFVLKSEMKEIFRLTETGARAVFLAKENGEAAGFIELSLHTSAPGCAGGRIGFSEGWFVKEGYRGRHIGAQLVAVGEQWARQQGCGEFAADTVTRYYPFSPAAHTALGFAIAKQENDHFYFCKKLN